MGVKRVAVAWGFAEATLFFIVPDVWSSWSGRDKLRQGLAACVFALVGALIGGYLSYEMGSVAPHGTLAAMQLLPAIDEPMIDAVRVSLAQQGATAVPLGPLSGTPYKLYAAQAAAAGIGPLAFLAISVPARLLRFVVVTVGVHALWHVAVHAGAAERGADRLLLAAWVIFYATFFAVMPG